MVHWSVLELNKSLEYMLKSHSSPDNLPIGVLRIYTQGLGMRRSQNKCLPKVEPRWTYLGEQWDPRALPNVKDGHKKII